MSRKDVSVTLAAVLCLLAAVPAACMAVERSASVDDYFEIMSREEALTRRQDGGVMMCPEVNWLPTDQCAYAAEPPENCIALTGDWYKNISSIGPDEYNVIVAYDDNACESEAQIALFYPGYSDLGTLGWDNRIGSMRVLQISGSQCMGQCEFADPFLSQSASCSSCCNGCSRTSSSCCPDGQQC